jgi:hypothetical protein
MRIGGPDRVAEYSWAVFPSFCTLAGASAAGPARIAPEIDDTGEMAIVAAICAPL